MDWSNWILGGSIIGILAACWRYVQGALWKVISLLICRTRCLNELSTAVRHYLVDTYPCSRWRDRMFASVAPSYIRPRGSYGSVAYELVSGSGTITVFWNGWRPLVVSLNNAADGLVLYCLRGTWDIEQLMHAANNAMNENSWARAASYSYASALSGPTIPTRRSYVRYVPAPGASSRSINSSTPVKSDSKDLASNITATSYGYRGIPWWELGDHRPVHYSRSDISLMPDPIANNALDQLFFPDHVQEAIHEVERWRSSKEWYQQRGIPWKRGWLLFGKPGTGKSCLVRAIAHDLDMPIYVFSLSELTNESFRSAWTELRGAAPVVALIEDIDATFHGRDNISRPPMGLSLFGPGMFDDDDDNDTDVNAPPARMDAKKSRRRNSGFPGVAAPLTFDCLINCLDGVELNEGVFTVVTTNDISKIDPAIGVPDPNNSNKIASTRPGRIDRAIELSYMTPKGKWAMARRIVSDYPEALETLRCWINDNPDVLETPAQFQDRCTQLALNLFWSDKHARQHEAALAAERS